MIYYKNYMITVLNSDNEDVLRTKTFAQFDLNVVRELITEALQSKGTLTFIFEQTATCLYNQRLITFWLKYDDELKLSLKTYKRNRDEDYEKFYSENFTSLLEWKRELERFLVMNIIETER